ncbi:hypothetical protein RHSIM_RhsimUnG0115500 [Rhododendron simsii]|uniref:Uncharacterized protein n=1 Tax=Rhododendron simsii TaxID=118357 RepID=A0A834FUM8_RHOSS|nr:hypothetical protein RHSIM_RhsimUnG0115500 [Rhododendron simsii]
MSNSDYNNAAAGWAAEAGEEKLTPRRARWNTGLFDCFARNDKFSTSDRQGRCEALNRSYGCWKCCLEHEDCYDIFIHLFCHACALCQEARELHRRLPDPGFNSQPLLVTIPSGQQTMGRES